MKKLTKEQIKLNNVELEYDDDDLITLILGTAAVENDDKTILEWLKNT